MAYDEVVAARLRGALRRTRGVTEKKMFGGICFFVRDNMLCGVAKRRFVFRVGKQQEARALAWPGASPMILSGRRIGGFVWIDAGRCRGRSLSAWIALAKAFVRTLPAK